MNAVSGIFVSVSLIFGGGYALNKIFVETQREAVMHIQRGLPSLSNFTERLTCRKITNSGKLILSSCARHEKR